jgi:hypothetical protein
MESNSVTGPAYLASALINGDESGLEARDEKDLAAFLRNLPDGAHIVDCGEEYIGHWNGLMCLVCEYTYLMPGDK